MWEISALRTSTAVLFFLGWLIQPCYTQSAVYDICGNNSLITTSNGTIQSPNYPSPYPSNQRCLVTVRGHSGQRVRIEIKHFSLEGVSYGGCPDWLIMRERHSTGLVKMIFEACGTNGKMVNYARVSAGSEIQLAFRSDGASGHYTGFSVDFQVIGCTIESFHPQANTVIKSYTHDMAEVECVAGYYFSSDAPDQGLYRCESNVWVNVGQFSACVDPTLPKSNTSGNTIIEVPYSMDCESHRDVCDRCHFNNKGELKALIKIAAVVGCVIVVLQTVMIAICVCKRKETPTNDSKATMLDEEQFTDNIHTVSETVAEANGCKVAQAHANSAFDPTECDPHTSRP